MLTLRAGGGSTAGDSPGGGAETDVRGGEAELWGLMGPPARAETQGSWSGMGGARLLSSKVVEVAEDNLRRLEGGGTRTRPQLILKVQQVSVPLFPWISISQ